MLSTARRHHRTNPDLPAQPTNALPGSPDKLAVLAARARQKQPLFHPRDFAFRERALVAWLRAPSEFRTALLTRL